MGMARCSIMIYKPTIRLSCTLLWWCEPILEQNHLHIVSSDKIISNKILTQLNTCRWLVHISESPPLILLLLLLLIQIHSVLHKVVRYSIACRWKREKSSNNKNGTLKIHWIDSSHRHKLWFVLCSSCLNKDINHDNGIAPSNQIVPNTSHNEGKILKKWRMISIINNMRSLSVYVRSTVCLL